MAVVKSALKNFNSQEMSIATVKVSNISLSVSEREIQEFFSFSGDIQYVEMQREAETTQLAFVTFKDSQGAETAMLLTGATIGQLPVNISLVEDYRLPPEAFPPPWENRLAITSSAFKKTEDVVSTMLAKGFILGKDAISKAKAFDEEHHLTSNATATVASFDQKMGLSEKISVGTSLVGAKMREMDGKFQVSEITKSALAVTEQKASSAGTAIMNNNLVLAGASWFSSAISVVAKAVEDVSLMTKEKVEKAEEEKKEIIYRERTGIINNFAELHLDESSSEPATVPVSSADR